MTVEQKPNKSNLNFTFIVGIISYTVKYIIIESIIYYSFLILRNILDIAIFIGAEEFVIKPTSNKSRFISIPNS
jgi:hypothetical protein